MRIYISGIGGVAMGPLAFMARDVGYDVVGSDATEAGNQVEYLRENGFKIYISTRAQHIEEEHEAKPIDWFVYTSALPMDHPELRYAREVGMKVSKRDDFINEILAENDLQMIAVAGTHGKTTTTAMIVWALLHANVPVSYSIGTRLSFGPFGKIAKGSKYFVYEADEFDRNFLNFNPAISVVTNIGYDHSDTYPSQADYDAAFAEFIQKSDSVYIYDDDFASGSDRIHVIKKDGEEASTTIPGKYNRQNARLVLEMLHNEFDMDYADVTDSINHFPGTSRRMEQIKPNLFTDYAHHPDEIRATMEIGMELADDVIAVYQPHQNVRQHEVLDGYGDCFEGASKVYWLPTYLSREDKSLDVLTPDQLVEGLTNKSVAQVSEMGNDLVGKIKSHLATGSTVIAMSAGDLDSWIRESFENDI